jgi:hypothetical protein
VSLIGNAVDAEELCKGLSAAATGSSEKYRKYEPGSEPDEDEDESLMTSEQIGEFI